MAAKILAAALIAAFIITMVAALIGAAQSTDSITKALGPF